MKIVKANIDETLIFVLDGRLDATTSPDLEKELETIGDVTSLMFDFSKIDYISSAGLRVMLAAQKIMNKQGKMAIKNVHPDVMEVFEITGFTDIIEFV